ncbi:Nif3-like dinuclear metal center hexameric protein [Konateibacter massiliensis]|uniref:Nif3-like dinuclear metal center hexameric protein n=1 Tax=Konateibacter massiliensis TaxID=2002841 RepID=UPI000C144AF1|nr:Nif3-like dinuclear metal center hexameric protein [Konateibacter massiliensis]
MKCNSLIEILEELSPSNLAEAWDNVGLQIGSAKKEINCVYIALDATDNVVNDAINKKADLLLTHHPLIFKGVKNITDEEFIGRRIRSLIQNDINYYAMHTNFDVTVMADLAADYLKLANQEILEKTDEAHGIGKIGLLPREMEIYELCEYVKEVFSLNHVKVFGDSDQKIKRVAVMPGSGKSYIQSAIRAEVQVMITGDIDHHEGIDAAASNLVIIDAGHYGIEHIFVKYMEEFIRNKFAGINVYAEERSDPFQII